MPRCSVPFCQNIGFHPFPTDRAKDWAIAIRRKNWTPRPSSRICRAHFLPSDYHETGIENGNENKKLKKNAIPSVFTWTVKKVIDSLPSKSTNHQKKLLLERYTTKTLDVDPLKFEPAEQSVTSMETLNTVGTANDHDTTSDIKQEPEDMETPEKEVSQNPEDLLDTAPLPPSVVRQIETYQKQIHNMRQKYQILYKECKRLNGTKSLLKVKKYVREPKEENHIKSLQSENKTNKKKSTEIIFNNMLTRNAFSSKFTYIEKLLSLCLYKKSNECYKLMSEFFNIPSIDTLKEMDSLINNKKILEVIARKRLNNSIEEENIRKIMCSIVFCQPPHDVDQDGTPQHDTNSHSQTISRSDVNQDGTQQPDKRYHSQVISGYDVYQGSTPQHDTNSHSQTISRSDVNQDGTPQPDKRYHSQAISGYDVYQDSTPQHDTNSHSQTISRSDVNQDGTPQPDKHYHSQAISGNDVNQDSTPQTETHSHSQAISKSDVNQNDTPQPDTNSHSHEISRRKSKPMTLIKVSSEKPKVIKVLPVNAKTLKFIKIPLNKVLTQIKMLASETNRQMLIVNPNENLPAQPSEPLISKVNEEEEEANRTRYAGGTLWDTKRIARKKNPKLDETSETHRQKFIVNPL